MPTLDWLYRTKPHEPMLPCPDRSCHTKCVFTPADTNLGTEGSGLDILRTTAWSYFLKLFYFMFFFIFENEYLNLKTVTRSKLKTWLASLSSCSSSCCRAAVSPRSCFSFRSIWQWNTSSSLKRLHVMVFKGPQESKSTADPCIQLQILGSIFKFPPMRIAFHTEGYPPADPSPLCLAHFLRWSQFVE